NPPGGWESFWDEAARRTDYTGGRPPVIADTAELARHGEDITTLVTKVVTPELLAATPHLKLVQVPIAGVETIDMALLRRAAIPLANSHDNREVTAEQALALMFALARRIVPYDRDMRRGIWHGYFIAAWEPVTALFGKTVGIAGLGNIGLHIAKVCKALGMTVRGLKRTPVSAQAADVDKIYLPDEKLEFLKGSDVVIDVLPLTAETQNFFGKAEFEAMRGHLFINIGRGGSVDEKALYDALKDGTLAGAGLDPWWIYPQIPTPRDETGTMIPVLPAHEPFWELDNVVLSPHIGGFTDISVRGLWTDSFENAIRADRGETPRNLVDLEHGY
ncbi:MAG: 2-hydroxyacid dehydrogenase, partial [Candidatus Cryosericum sp.]